MCKESINTVLLCLMLVARSALSVVVAITMGHAAGAIVATDWKNFLRQLRKFALIGIPASLVNSGIKYITSILSLRFQRRLTDRLNKNYVRAHHTGPPHAELTVCSIIYSSQAVTYYGGGACR